MNSPDKHFDNAIKQRSRELWHQASQQLDPATAGRLRAVRRQALECQHAPTHHRARWLIPTGAFAVIALAALMVWQPLPRTPAAPQAIQAQSNTSADLDELPPDADQTDPNLYQNLDFYGWLAANNTPAKR